MSIVGSLQQRFPTWGTPAALGGSQNFKFFWWFSIWGCANSKRVESNQVNQDKSQHVKSNFFKSVTIFLTFETDFKISLVKIFKMETFSIETRSGRYFSRVCRNCRDKRRLFSIETRSGQDCRDKLKTPRLKNDLHLFDVHLLRPKLRRSNRWEVWLLPLASRAPKHVYSPNRESLTNKNFNYYFNLHWNQ